MNEPGLIAHVTNVLEYFRDAFCASATKQKLKLAQETEHYIVSLLTSFLRSEKLYVLSSSGAYRKPLMTELLNKAMEGTSVTMREQGLQRLGDVALFTAGFSGDSFERKLLDVDYYVSMGRRAYGSLAEGAYSKAIRAQRATFSEITHKFVPITDILNEIAEGGQNPAVNVLRAYEVWLKTGSARAQGKLLKAGIQPVRVASLGTN